MAPPMKQPDTRLHFLNRDNKLPDDFYRYDREDNLPRGIYLELYHGRLEPDTDMEDWGFDCPYLIGPFQAVVHTYHTTTRLVNWDRDHLDIWLTNQIPEDLVSRLEPGVLASYRDMLYLDGSFYGDWAFVYR